MRFTRRTLARLAFSTALAVASGAAVSRAGEWPPTTEESPRETIERLLAVVRRVAARDRDPARRAWAWRALARANDDSLGVMLPAGLADRSSGVRVEALRSVHDLVYATPERRGETRRAVAEALASNDPALHWAAKRIVDDARGRDEDGRPWNDVSLGAGLLNDSAAVRDACRKAIEEGKTFAAEIPTARLAAAMTGSPATRLEVLRSLTPEELAAPHWRIVLAAATTAESRELRQVATLLWHESREEACTRLLTDPDPVLRATVFNAPLVPTTHHARRLVLQGLVDPDALVVEAALAHAWKHYTPLLLDSTSFRARAADPNDERGDLAAAIAWRAVVDGRAAGEQVSLPRLDDGFARLWAAAAELGDVARATSNPVKPVRGDAATSPGHAIVVRAAESLDDADPLVRRAACGAIAEGCCWLGRHDFVVGVDSLRALWDRVFARLDDPDARVRRAAARQLLVAYERTSFPGRLRYVEECVGRALEHADSSVARIAAEFYATNRWKPAAGPFLKSALADWLRDDVVWNLRLQHLLSRAPTLFADDELIALLDGSGGPASGWTERLCFEQLVKRKAHAAVARQLDRRVGERGEGLRSEIVTQALSRATETEIATDAILARLDPAAADSLVACVAEYWSHEEPAVRRVHRWARELDSPWALRLAALEVIEQDYQWVGEDSELDEVVGTALDSPDPLVTLHAFCTLVSWLNGGREWEPEELSALAKRLSAAAAGWADPFIPEPESL